MALVRRNTDGVGPVGGKAAQDAELTKLAPTLLEWMTEMKWLDGMKRKTGTIMLLAEDGVWKAWLHDRDGNCSGWLSGGSLFDLLANVEQGLRDDTVNWRADRKGGKG